VEERRFRKQRDAELGALNTLLGRVEGVLLAGFLDPAAARIAPIDAWTGTGNYDDDALVPNIRDSATEAELTSWLHKASNQFSVVPPPYLSLSGFTTLQWVEVAAPFGHQWLADLWHWSGWKNLVALSHEQDQIFTVRRDWHEHDYSCFIKTVPEALAYVSELRERNRRYL
jgi:hypothetical protein